MDKYAFLVLGAESSGTRMLTKALVLAGVWGDYTHGQRIDNLLGVMDKAPPYVVMRRSLPHARMWPRLDVLSRQLRSGGHKLIPLGIEREERYTIKSQLTDQQHAQTATQARDNIARAKKLIKAQRPLWVASYERFVSNEDYRAGLFAQIGLEVPEMQFYNANQKYETNMA